MDTCWLCGSIKDMDGANICNKCMIYIHGLNGNIAYRHVLCNICNDNVMRSLEIYVNMDKDRYYKWSFMSKM